MQQRERDVGAMSKSIGIVMVITLIAKLAGFGREVIFASHFGTVAVSDAYKNALLIPGFILSILITAFTAALIPMFPSQSRQGDSQTNRFMSNLFTVGMAVSACILLLTLLFIRPIITGIFLPFADPETQRLAIELSSIMLGMELFVFLARAVTAYLQANFLFTIPALSLLFQNLVLIGAIVLAGGSIYIVAIGTVVSWAVQFLVQVPAAYQVGLRYRPRFDLSDPGLRGAALLMLPAIIPAAFDSLYPIFAHSIASQNIGHISALDYGNRLSTLVSAVLLTTVATVLYPNLVGHVQEPKKLSDDLRFGINLNLLIALPASVALMLLAQPITRLVYERGKFTSESTLLTASTLACYAAGILGIGLREICNRCFYAYQAKRVPFIVGIGVLVLNVVLNYALYPVYGPSGIAASMAISSLLSGFSLLILLHIHKKVIDWPRIFHCFWKVSIATAAMSAALLALTNILSVQSLIGRRFDLAMLLIICIGVVVYAALLWLLKTEELSAVISFVKKKLQKESASS